MLSAPLVRVGSQEHVTAVRGFRGEAQFGISRHFDLDDCSDLAVPWLRQTLGGQHYVTLRGASLGSPVRSYSWAAWRERCASARHGARVSSARSQAASGSCCGSPARASGRLLSSQRSLTFWGLWGWGGRSDSCGLTSARVRCRPFSRNCRVHRACRQGGQAAIDIHRVVGEPQGHALQSNSRSASTRLMSWTLPMTPAARTRWTHPTRLLLCLRHQPATIRKLPDRPQSQDH